jgi:hypothetical protein
VSALCEMPPVGAVNVKLAAAVELDARIRPRRGRGVGS